LVPGSNELRKVIYGSDDKTWEKTILDKLKVIEANKEKTYFKLA